MDYTEADRHADILWRNPEALRRWEMNVAATDSARLGVTNAKQAAELAFRAISILQALWPDSLNGAADEVAAGPIDSPDSAASERLDAAVTCTLVALAHAMHVLDD